MEILNNLDVVDCASDDKRHCTQREIRHHTLFTTSKRTTRRYIWAAVFGSRLNLGVSAIKYAHKWVWHSTAILKMENNVIDREQRDSSNMDTYFLGVGYSPTGCAQVEWSLQLLFRIFSPPVNHNANDDNKSDSHRTWHFKKEAAAADYSRDAHHLYISPVSQESSQPVRSTPSFSLYVTGKKSSRGTVSPRM